MPDDSINSALEAHKRGDFAGALEACARAPRDRGSPLTGCARLLGPGRLVPGRAAMFVLTHPSGRLDGGEVRFIERAAEVRDWYLKLPGSPLGQLLVAPEDAPARP